MARKIMSGIWKKGKEAIVEYLLPAGIEANDMINTYNEVTEKINSILDDKEQREILLEELFEIALESKRDIKSATDIYTTLAPALNEKGYGNFEQAELSQNLSNLFTSSNTAKADIEKVLKALSTSFENGKMAEEEFIAILYAKEEVVESLALGMKVDIEGFKQLVSDGKMTNEKIFQALENNARYLKAQVDKMPLKTYDDVIDRLRTKTMADLNKNLKGKEKFSEISAGLIKTLLGLIADGLIEPFTYYNLSKITKEFQDKEAEIKNKMYKAFEEKYQIEGNYENNPEYKKKFDETYKALFDEAMNEVRDKFIEKANPFLETFDKKVKEREEKRGKLFRAKPENNQDEVEENNSKPDAIFTVWNRNPYISPETSSKVSTKVPKKVLMAPTCDCQEKIDETKDSISDFILEQEMLNQNTIESFENLKETGDASQIYWENWISNMQSKLTNFNDMIANGINNFTNAFSNALFEIARGSQSVEDAFRTMLASLLENTVRAVSQMIAQYTALAAVKALAGIPPNFSTTLQAKGGIFGSYLENPLSFVENNLIFEDKMQKNLAQLSIKLDKDFEEAELKNIYNSSRNTNVNQQINIRGNVDNRTANQIALETNRKLKKADRRLGDK